MDVSDRHHLLMNISRFAASFVLGPVMVLTGAASPRGAVSAQAPNPCALLTVEDIEPIANGSVAEGVSSSLAATGSVACRYTWGAGVNRFKLEVTVNDVSRMFPGTSPDEIKQRLLESVRAGTTDAIIPEVGEAAMFIPDSPVYASATAFVKGRILKLYLDGIYASEKKDPIIALLKLAASRL